LAGIADQLLQKRKERYKVICHLNALQLVSAPIPNSGQSRMEPARSAGKEKYETIGTSRWVNDEI
jgi:hypothetical protein